MNVSGEALALSGDQVDSLIRLAGAAVLGALAFVVMRRSPRLAVAAWLAVVCAVPVWSGIEVGVYFEPQVLMGLVVAAALVTVRRGDEVRLTIGDVVMVAFVTSALVPVALGGATLDGVFVLLAQWSGAYVLGRLVGIRLPLPWVYGAVAVAFSCVAALAVVEFGTGWNPFLSFPGSGSLHATWASIQYRGGLPRTEGAFGHSIALGGSLALALPLALAAPFRAGLRLGMATLLLVACAVTFSRIGLGTAVLGVLLTVAFLRTGLSARSRALLAAGLVVAGAAVTPFVLRVFEAAGDEAADSAGYRARLLGLLSEVQVLGISPSHYRLPTGEAFFGSFRSIDSSFVLVGLTYGWIPLACLLTGAVLALAVVLSGRATPPTIALVAQLPAVATVALITQYSGWMWFLAGLAVASQAAGRVGDAGSATAPDDGAPDEVPGTHPSGWQPLAVRSPADTFVAVSDRSGHGPGEAPS
jgi:hypothetical protein